MTLPQNVKDAVQDMGSVGPHEEVFGDRVQGWLAVISTHLMSQEAEIVSSHAAELRLSIRAELAESRLAAANALISDVKEWDVGEAVRRFSPSDNGAIFTLPDALRSRIQAHLQGAGDE